MSRVPDVLPTWQDFGADLILTYDLDPIYPMVVAADMDDDMRKRWCLAYWCFYHAGVSSVVAERSSKYFYEEMRSQVTNKCPRGMERRYFYGNLAWNTIEGLDNFGSPEQVVDMMTLQSDFQSANVTIQEFYGFGSWIAWKIADMADRVLQIELDFSDTNLNMYKDPKQGAAYILKGDKHDHIDEWELEWVVNWMEDEFAGLLAPPFQDRPINIQEVETVLCKYKAHCFGFYPYGNDTIHVAKALPGWGDLAQSMIPVLRDYTTYLRGVTI